MTAPADAVSVHDSAEAMRMAQELGDLYQAAYADLPQASDPFYSAERFATRLAGYADSPGFALAVARDVTGTLNGYAFGYALPVGARWWEGLIGAVPESFTFEDGSRTFALCELHVGREGRGQGLATRLHQELIASGPYQRATVLVRPDNPAKAIYTRWGYRPVGELKPYADSPTYVALVLPIGSPT